MIPSFRSRGESPARAITLRQRARGGKEKSPARHKSRLRSLSPAAGHSVLVRVGFQFLLSVRVLVSAMLVVMLVVMAMLVYGMGVLVGMLMVVYVAVLVRVFMAMGYSLVGVLVRMAVGVVMLVRVIVFVFAFHLSPQTRPQPLDAHSAASATESCSRITLRSRFAHPWLIAVASPFVSTVT